MMRGKRFTRPQATTHSIFAITTYQSARFSSGLYVNLFMKRRAAGQIVRDWIRGPTLSMYESLHTVFATVSSCQPIAPSPP
ncbi:unnamed protein product [Echinostoma caproni]|uniref:Uncharacterized protein n=1 Tax=Echinostoma caproni TaxID=27848 RepID=A0A183APP7_9TREM|nr:unnamed protein product [Echinostoma caproni]